MSAVSIYVAAQDRWAACHVRDVAVAMGLNVVSTWHDEAFNPTSAHTEDDRGKIANLDLSQIEASDALVLVAGHKSTGNPTGGKYVEAGFALGLGRPVVIVGHRENMLLWSKRIQAFDDPMSALSSLL